MSDRESHCPFLNRSDARCGTHFSLDRLDTAFDHCVGCYAACPTYQELLGERRERHQHKPQGHRPGGSDHGVPQHVQVRVAAAHPGHVPAA